MAKTHLPLVATNISAGSVRMRFADHPEPAQATEWLDFQVPLVELDDPSDPRRKIGNVETQLIAELRLAALRYVREIVGDETQRLSALAGRG